MGGIWTKSYDEPVPYTITYPNVTLYQLLESAVQKRPSHTAVLFYGARTSYEELSREVDRFAAALFSLGVGQGDRVALILPNLPIYPIAHFATMRLGGILVPTNPLYVERELEHQLNNAEAETVVVLDQLYPRVARIRPRTGIKRIIVAGVQDFLPALMSIIYRFKNKPEFRANPAEDVFSYQDLRKGSYPDLPAHSVKLDDTAILLYTGGTTGISKGAVLTHRNLTVNVIQTRQWLWSMKEGREVILSALPFFHSYGMTTALHLAILSHATMVLLPRFDLPEVVKRIRKHKPTIFCGVPSMYNAINRYPKIQPEDVNSIRLCVSGGAALPEEIQTRFEKLTGGKLVEGYGLSETSPVAIVNPLHGNRRSGTIGLPISDTEARVVDAERRPLPAGRVGELALKGPQVMKGYWKMEEETDRVLAEGWLYTGDMAVMDEEGFFRIVDRKKDIIISAGMNVYPREIEEVLLQHPSVVEAAVVGTASKVREEVVKAYVVLEKDTKVSKSELIQFCRERLSKYKLPRQIEFREELPKSSVGKILKRVLLDEEKASAKTQESPLSASPSEDPEGDEE